MGREVRKRKNLTDWSKIVKRFYEWGLGKTREGAIYAHSGADFAQRGETRSIYKKRKGKGSYPWAYKMPWEEARPAKETAGEYEQYFKREYLR